MSAEQGYWARLARQWEQLPPPLRPHPDDVRLMRGSLTRWLSAAPPRSSAPLALILGVTPEYWSLFQSLGADTHALDLSPDMIGAVWPGLESRAVEGNWLEMPYSADSFDWVACDGGLACLPHPDGQRRVLRETARVLRAGGLCSFRLFTPAEGEHRLEDLESLLRARRISNSSELKLWLWSVLQPDPVQGVPLRHVWQRLTQTLPSLESLLLELDWRPDALDSLRAYAHSAHAYHLITEPEAMALFSDADLEVVSVERSAYSMSERCPTIVARKLSGAA